MAITLDGTSGITTPDLTDSSLTANRVVYAGTGGNLTGSANLTYNGSVLSQTGRLQVYNSSGADGGFRLSSTGDVSFYDFEVSDTLGLEIQDNNTPRLTINKSGNIKNWGSISVGNVTPTTSGIGITFPATQSASSDANTLDDYEEGTWSPTVYIGETSNSIATASGTYTKIGNVVFFACRAESVTKSGTGGLTIRNLPFAASSSGNQNRYAQQLVRWTGINPGGVVIGLADPGASAISFQFFTTTGGYGGAVSDSQISASFSLYGVSGFYYTT